jgi:adenylate/guanylate cyclase family protein/PEGA domain-containing protein
MQAGRGNRTFICSVAFLDIIEYSKKGVTSQIALKEQLNRVLGEALKGVAATDRIILDTVDGAAISFVGDPEQALFVSLVLRNAVEQRKPGVTDELNVRIGINLGPVKLIKDLNGQANIVGDGINVAQRIMSFAEPNQILVSRSYYEVVSCLSEAYGKMFHYEGSRTDKHVREHEVYAVGDSAGELRQSIEAAQTATSQLPFGLSLTRSVVDRLASTTVRATVRVRDGLHARPRLSTALAVAAILALAITVRATRDRPPVQVAQAPAAPPAVKNVAPPQAEKAAPAPREAAPAPKAEVKAPEEKPAPPARKEKARAKAPKRTETAQAAQAPASSALPGVVALAIAPWGEIIVDGKSLGVSPPLQELRLAPGRHRIEVRNTSFTPHVQIVEVNSGERIRIRHRFQ